MAKGVFVLVFALGPVAMFAAGFGFLPFGGRVLTAPIPGAVCPTALDPLSPFMNIPVGLNIPGPFASVPGPQTVGQVVPGAWILGNYLTTPIPDCFVGVPGAGQVPVYKAFMYGTSVPVPSL